MRTLVLALLVVGTAACTVDDDIVEGKECYLGGGDPEKTCMSGYECKCGGGKCLCEKTVSLGYPLHERRGDAIERCRSGADPSLTFLRRLGLEP